MYVYILTYNTIYIHNKNVYSYYILFLTSMVKLCIRNEQNAYLESHCVVVVFQ